MMKMPPPGGIFSFVDQITPVLTAGHVAQPFLNPDLARLEI